MRQFIRHPVNIPIIVTAADKQAKMDTHTIGVGGLSFLGEHHILPGTVVQIEIPFFQPPFQAEGRVLWSREGDSGTELGVEFLSTDDAYRTRMVEQICHIEHYRRQIAKEEGRQLTSHEAALEWISKFAAQFPKLES